MEKKLALIALVVAVIALGGYFAPTPAKEVVREIVKELGAVPGSVFPGPSITINGSEIVARRVPMQTGTTTVCSIQSPNATSSLLYAIGSFTTTGTSTNAGSTFSIYGSGAGRTSTSAPELLGRVSAVPATNPLPTVAATSSNIGGDSPQILEPNTYVVFDLQGQSVPFLGAGFCNVGFVLATN